VQMPVRFDGNAMETDERVFFGGIRLIFKA
jgi:hypothetical protein